MPRNRTLWNPAGYTTTDLSLSYQCQLRDRSFVGQVSKIVRTRIIWVATDGIEGHGV